MFLSLMSDSVVGKKTGPSFESQLQEQYISKLNSVEEGQIVSGHIIEVGQETVFVDVGLKSEGRISIDEFIEVPKIGSEVKVVLLRKEGRHGEVLVSKRKADEQIVWKNLKGSGESGNPVQGNITKKVKGGYEVDIGAGLKAFVPFSKVDIARVQDQDVYVGLQTRFFVEQLYNRGKANIVLNRKAWLEKESSRKREQFYKSVAIGDVYRGTVKSFTSFGAFIDLGGFDGLLHVNDMRWGHLNSPKDVVLVGEEVDVKVIRIDVDLQKVNLSLKHFTPDPWTKFEEKFSEEDIVVGNVTKITDFGAFIEIEEGIEGLLHISDMSWVKKVNHPKQIVNIGDEVKVKILKYNLDEAKLSLGLKHILPNPWDDIEERFSEGKVIKGTVKNVTNYGAFVRIEEGIDGLLHIEDMSWSKRIRNPNNIVKPEQELDVVVVSVDKENRRIRLGIKQLSEDPWEVLAKAFKPGSIIDGEVTNKTEFGVFVKVQGDIEGLIANSQMNQGDEENAKDGLLDTLKKGSKISAVVTDINIQRKRLSLSLRELKKKQEREDIVKYIHDDTDSEKVSLGYMLKEKSAN